MAKIISGGKAVKNTKIKPVALISVIIMVFTASSVSTHRFT